MKRECKYKQDEYQVWSGVENPKKRGVYLIYWRGILIGQERYLDLAQGFIDKHKHKQMLRQKFSEPIKKETQDWLDKMFGESK